METITQTACEPAHHEHHVRVHIDRQPYETPNPTTGAALYLLGKVAPGRQLYLEVQGDEEDEPIYNDDEKERLRQDGHFYSEEGRHKGFEIVVNAQPEHVDTKRVSFEKVVRFAFPKSPAAIPCFVVTYDDGPKENPSGTLTAGHSVKVKNKMVFDVQATNRS